MASLSELFSSPPTEYRPVPQWSWNGNMTPGRITEQLEQFAAQGCGGLFAHARQGHVNGYLTDQWFDIWGHALREARRLGLRFHIYDEFTCPAGLAGGNLTAQDPTLIQHELNLVPIQALQSGQTPVLLLRLDPNGHAEITDDANDATNAIVLCQSCGHRMPLPMPDLLQPGTARLFLSLTHERYRERFGEAFGRDIIFMFSDEPMILAGSGGLPFSRHLQREFVREHGYALDGEALVGLCLARQDSPEIRFDFWRTVNRLFNQNFMKPLHDWCEANNLLFTGHLMEHEWPCPSRTPDNMSGLRWMHAPGEDLLGFQFSPASLAENGLYLLNLKELSSVTSQLGRSWSMVETCGGRGYHTAFSYFKPCEDFTLSFGVNVIDPHLAHQTLSGIGKYDWPQTLSDHSPWWNYYRTHADHVARVSTALSQGKEHNRVLVLMPTTTGWMHYTGTDFDKACGEPGKRKLEWIRETQTDLMLALYGAQVDFDLGDEFILEEFGRVEGGKLVVGERAYEAVVVPPAMETLNSSTLQLLRRSSDERLPVLALAVPGRMDGRLSDEPANLAETGSWQRLTDTEALVEELRHLVPPYVSRPDGEAVPGGLVWRRTITAEGELWFFCNPWPEPIETEVRLAGASVKRLDTADGRIEDHPAEQEEQTVRVKLSLPSRGHELLLVSDAPASAPVVHASRVRTPITLTPRGVRRVHPNLLYVDYCDIEAYGQRRTDMNTAAADTLNWCWQGFDGNPWFRQFRRTLIDRPVEPGTGFAAVYRFSIAPGTSPATLKTLRAGIERPELYSLTLNGTALNENAGQRWFDERMASFPIGDAACIGENALTLTAEPFHMLCQIMPVYILGDFSLEPAERGFVIRDAVQPELGDWTAQGMPFYPDRVRYEYGFSLKGAAGGLVVRVPRWEGSVAAVHLDRRETGVVMHPPYECRVPGPVATGEHTLAVDVLGNVKNMMGSHHVDGVPLRYTFEHGPEHMPPGRDYRVAPTGLLEPIELFEE